MEFLTLPIIPHPLLVPPMLWEHCYQLQTTLLKCTGRTLAATSAAGLSHLSRLFYVSDRATGFRFLVDTGAAVSVVPPSHTECLHQRQDLGLQAVNNTKSRLTVCVPCPSSLAFFAPFDGSLS